MLQQQRAVSLLSGVLGNDARATGSKDINSSILLLDNANIKAIAWFCNTVLP